LPLPHKSLTVERLTLTPPEVPRAVIADLGFKASAGDAIAILGASASGKSSLLRGIIGAWLPSRGEIRLDGARLDQWDSDLIGRTIGYMPQSVELFGGSVAENIARFEPNAPAEAVIAAARAAGVHDIILQLPEGYETQVGEDGQHVSAGQRQRIGLARALYRDPFLVVLDEPNSNLDPVGEEALAQAIIDVRRRNGIVLVAAHRTSILKAVNLVLLMHAGQSQGFGPRDEMLARIAEARNRAQAPAPTPAGGAGPLTVVPKRS
jgi:ATP-binding cassette subfamily C protein